MNINITSIELEKGEQQKGFRLSLTSDNHPDKTFYYFGENELDFLLDCINGKAKFYPYFDDGLYALKCYPQGLHCAYTSSDEQYWFTFPFNELTVYIEEIQRMIELEKEYTANLTPLIETWINVYSPVVRVEWHGENIESRFLDDIDNPKVKNRDYAVNWLERQIKMCESYSDGNIITLHICYDGYQERKDNPCSYYWYIMDEQNRRLMNGGFIAHHYNRDGQDCFEYATHT